MKKSKLLRTVSFFTGIFLLPMAVFGQAAWWEPAAPLVGGTVTIYYDDLVGTLPDGSAQCWLHWGVVDDDGNWSQPAEELWPEGSQGSGDGAACQSPMSRNEDDFWSLELNPDTTISAIAFVFTDQQNNWDNNNGNNWRIDFVSGDIVAWWSPEEPEPGDEVTIYYNAAAGTIPTSADQINLHWGINEAGHGNWNEPPEEMWPEDTVPWGDGMAVQSPMNELGDNLWSVSIPSNDTTYSIHFVFTTGSDWDTNSGANWDILLEEPPPVIETWHTFIFDSRSSYSPVNPDNINRVFVAGPFNNWSTSADQMDGPDDNGVYYKELQIPASATPYKFVVNGTNWIQDPDNPITDGGSTMNSLVVLDPDSLPYVTHILPAEGVLLQPDVEIELSALVRTSDFEDEVTTTPVVTLNGEPVEITWNSSTYEIAGTIILPQGASELAFTVEDVEGNTNTVTHWLGAYDSELDGYYAVDPEGDDVGTGEFSYPSGVADGAADILGARVLLSPGGNGLQFEVDMAEITDETRVMLTLDSELNLLPAGSFNFDTEVFTPDWNGHGIQICLAHPESPDFNVWRNNRLYVSRDPAVPGIPLTLIAPRLEENTFSFVVNISHLEAVLGSFAADWYISIYSFLEGPTGTDGHSWEVDETHGGSDLEFDPDIFDMVYVDNRLLQTRILANYSGNRTTTLDNVGRGYGSFTPEDIGEGIGSNGPNVRILSRGAATVRPNKTIVGLSGMDTEVEVTLHQQYEDGEHIHEVQAMSDTFEVDVTLEPGINTFWAVVQGEEPGISPAVMFELQVDHSPQPVLEASVDGGLVVLDASQSTDPEEQQISYQWTADPDNPDMIQINNANQPIATFVPPDTPGEYYVNLRLEDTDGNISRARTFATVYPDSVHPFDWNESAQWVRDAIVYEIFPRSYSDDHSLNSIANDMPRMAELGINAIWLMPIYPGPTDHGYEIVDYYGIEQDYGTPDDFRRLVTVAHNWGIRIILDCVINHTSIQHPFMREAIQYGRFSDHWDFYERDNQGNHRYYYDWYSLPNVNYSNPDAWEHFIRMCEWWVTEFDVDGYRCDVAWGPMERNNAFWIEWRRRLKLIKPELFLLAEATSTDFNYFDHRFDLALDWNLHHEGSASLANMFPGPPNLNSLHNLVTNYGVSYPDYHFPFRFMENHDETRYISFNTPQQTRLASSLLLTIPGVPMLYAGQEVGTTSQRGTIRWDYDPENMYPHYRKLVQARRNLPALRTDNVMRLDNSAASQVYSYARYLDGEVPVITAFNFTLGSPVVHVTVPIEELGLHPDSTYVLSEILGGTHIEFTGSELQTITTSLSANQGRIYTISDSAIVFDAPETSHELPVEYSLEQNYPNPFNPQTWINFSLPVQGEVEIAVYNILGRRVRTLVQSHMPAGIHTVHWDGTSQDGTTVASGTYFYRIQAGGFTASRRMVLLK